MITLSFSFEINFETLATAWSFCLTFLPTKLRRGSKESLLSTVTPNNLTIFSLLIRLPLTLVVCYLLFTLHEIYHFSFKVVIMKPPK